MCIPIVLCDQRNILTKPKTSLLGSFGHVLLVLLAHARYSYYQIFFAYSSPQK